MVETKVEKILCILTIFHFFQLSVKFLVFYKKKLKIYTQNHIFKLSFINLENRQLLFLNTYLKIGKQNSFLLHLKIICRYIKKIKSN